ncbi:hypothetical protein MBLNU230_g7329t2 [Neophaeotheca triangularis]
MDPVPLERRTCGKGAFITYWFSDLVTISTWTTGSSIVTNDLMPTDAVLIVPVAGICNAIPTVLDGAIGAYLYIAFPVAFRASFGYWFSYFAVISRAILAMFWFGIQSAQGGTCVTAVITAIWPHFAALSSHLPESAGLTTAGMISYFIYWLVQFPLLLIPTHKLQYPFWVKTIVTPPMAVAMVIWITVRAGGAGEFFYIPSTVHGSMRAWLWLSNLTAVTGGYSTLAVNISGFSHFSKSARAQYWQLPVIPIFKTPVGCFGIVSASAAESLFGAPLWPPLDIIATWQDTPGGRAAAFFAALIWLLAQVSVNISTNAVSFANDICTVAPRYFNLRRGTLFVSLIGGWAL